MKTNVFRDVQQRDSADKRQRSWQLAISISSLKMEKQQ